MKMYILASKEVPLGFAVNSIAHASLACFLKFASYKNMQIWLANSFKKVTCAVTDAELMLAMQEISDCVVITESALNNRVVAVAFCPREEWPQNFKSFNLFR